MMKVKMFSVLKCRHPGSRHFSGGSRLGSVCPQVQVNETSMLYLQNLSLTNRMFSYQKVFLIIISVTAWFRCRGSGPTTIVKYRKLNTKLSVLH